VLSALAYGTVHYWALGLFNLGGLTLLVLWVLDGWRLGSLRVSRNLLQLPLLGALALGLIQLLPLREVASSGAASNLVNTLSLDPYSTRLVLVQLATLLIYFAATLVFVDTPHRLHILVRTIMIFGFCLAIFALTQSFTSAPTTVYWIRELPQSTAFGPFINRHHFAGYMELTIALPLGLLFAGAVEKDKRLLYLFVAGMMGIALVMTTSRGGIVSLVAEIMFLVVVTAIWRKKDEHHSRRSRRKSSPLKPIVVRTGLAAALLVGLFIGVIMLGGEFSIYRFIDSVNTDDPTTGRAHFWSVTLDIIKAHPYVGTGLGAFGVIYTKYDSRNGLFRLEQAHNDYLQVLSDGGIIGAVLALSFVVLLFYLAIKRAKSTKDDFRRAVALACLSGCFAVLVHSFFDFTLHTTSNALLFLVLAALATQDGRVEGTSRKRRRASAERSLVENSKAVNIST
jgi:O-antigen ligase